MLSSAEEDIMQLLLEDDYGLWEVAWRLGGAEMAAPTVERLCNRGLVELYVRDWPDADPVPASHSGREIDLRDPHCWEEPSAGGSQWLLVATDKGREIIAHASSGRPLEEE